MVDNLRAYFQIVEVSSLLDLERDISDHAVQLFRDCSSTTYLRNRNIEALAIAALVQAMREAKEARTLQEISAAANIPQKEIHKYMKVLSDALKLSQPINSNSISVYMPRFCSILELEKPTQDLATHIGEVVMDKSFCTRRNPISISAAAIYLSCQLEDKRKTQTEICKATALTEVTLRKVYKELLENLSDLLPPNYTPAVPPEKAFPVSGSALGRACGNRGAAAVGTSLPDSSVTTSTCSPVLAMSTSGLQGTGVLPDGSNGLGTGASTSCMRSSSANIVRATSSTFNTTRSTNNVLGPLVSTVPAEAASQDRINQLDTGEDRGQEWAKEKDRKRMDADATAFGALKFPSVKGNNVGPPFNPFPPFFPDLAPGSWPPQASYGAPAVRSDEAVSGNRDDRCREDGLLRLASKGSQFAGVTPSSLGDGTASLSSPLKPFHFMGFTDTSHRQTAQDRDEEKGQSEHFDRQGDARSPPVPEGPPGSLGNFNFPATTTTNVRSPLFQGFPQGMWGFNPGASIRPGVFPQQLINQCGGLLPVLPQVAEVNSDAERGGKGGMTSGDLSFQGHGDTSAEPASHLPSGLASSVSSGSASQPSASQPPFLGWRPLFPHRYLSPTNSKNISSDGNGEVSAPLRRGSGLADGVDTSSGLLTRYPYSGVGARPLPSTDFRPKVSMGFSAGMQASSLATNGAASQRSQDSGKLV